MERRSEIARARAVFTARRSRLRVLLPAQINAGSSCVGSRETRGTFSAGCARYSVRLIPPRSIVISSSSYRRPSTNRRDASKTWRKRHAIASGGAAVLIGDEGGEEGGGESFKAAGSAGGFFHLSLIHI